MARRTTRETAASESVKAPAGADAAADPVRTRAPRKTPAANGRASEPENPPVEAVTRRRPAKAAAAPPVEAVTRRRPAKAAAAPPVDAITRRRTAKAAAAPPVETPAAEKTARSGARVVVDFDEQKLSAPRRRPRAVPRSAVATVEPVADEPVAAAPDREDDSIETAGRPFVTVPRIIAAAVALVLVVALVLTTVSWLSTRGRLSDADRLQRARDSALATAQSYAVDFLSYSYQTLDTDFARVIAESTGDFKAKFSGASAQLGPVIRQAQAKTTAKVTAAGVVSATIDTVVVDLFVDQQVTNTSTPTPRTDRSLIEMTLKADGSGWLIGDVVLK